MPKWNTSTHKTEHHVIATSPSSATINDMASHQWNGLSMSYTTLNDLQILELLYVYEMPLPNNAYKHFMVYIEMWFMKSFIYVIRFAKRGLIHAQFQEHFHRHLLATSMHQQHMCLILLKFKQPAFTQAFSQACLTSRMLRWPLMALSSLGKQTADCESLHNWLMRI